MACGVYRFFLCRLYQRLTSARALIDPQVDRVWRQIVIARLPRLRVLDGTSVRASCSCIRIYGLTPALL
jgi:hypothetical protein